MSNKEVIVSSGYTNFGTDDEPEWVWNIAVCPQNDDECLEMYWFGENSIWGHIDKARFFGPGSLELAEVNNIYIIAINKDAHNFLELSTYGCRTTEGNFIPLYLLIRESKGEDAEIVNNIWIDYSEEKSDQMYSDIKDAIRDLNMAEISLTEK